MNKLLFWCFTLVVTQLNATFYRGKIGKSTIVMQLELREDGVAYGSYFYDDQALDIQFDGTYKEKKLDLFAGPFLAENSQKEHFILKKKGLSLVGKWKYKGQKLKVSLVEFQPSIQQSPYAGNRFYAAEISKLFDPLAIARSSLAVFKPMDSVTTLKNGIELQWFKETHWDSKLFRISKGLPGDQLKAVNDYLELIQVTSFCARGGCGTVGSDTTEDYEYTNEVVDYFVNADFLSLQTLEGFYCGGAHPDHASLVWNFDLKASKILTTDDLIQFPGFVRKTEDNFDAWSEYRGGSFAPVLVELLDSLYPEYLHPAEINDESCDYHQLDVWSWSDATITAEGLKFSAYFPRVMRSCDDPEWAVVPYSALKKYLNPEYAERLMSIAP